MPSCLRSEANRVHAPRAGHYFATYFDNSRLIRLHFELLQCNGRATGRGTNCADVSSRPTREQSIKLVEDVASAIAATRSHRGWEPIQSVVQRAAGWIAGHGASATSPGRAQVVGYIGRWHPGNLFDFCNNVRQRRPSRRRLTQCARGASRAASNDDRNGSSGSKFPASVRMTSSKRALYLAASAGSPRLSQTSTPA